MVLGFLCGASLREHPNYLRRKTRLIISSPGHQTRTRADKIFTELWRAVPKWDNRAARHNTCISEAMWRLVYKRVSARKESGRDQERIRQLGWEIRLALKKDR